MVIDKMTNTQDREGMTSNLLRACKQMTHQFNEVRFEVVLREQNTVADGLAKLAKQLPHDVHIFPNPPGEVLKLLEDDRNGIPQWRLVTSTS